ncbi:MAG TPA: hypothetical protein VK897_17690 [Anaerolineales bacterium]|nr:hypothetical protein [Anaerolineales bacterium]
MLHRKMQKQVFSSFDFSWKTPFRFLVSLAVMITLTIPAASQNASAQQEDHPWREVRTIDMADYGLSSVQGLAFSPDANTFLLWKTDGSVAGITMHEDAVLTNGLRIPAEDAHNISFDPRTNRLFVLNSASGQLEEFSVNAAGLPIATGPARRHALNAINLQSARGITFDPATGRLFILNAQGNQLVIVSPDPTSGFDVSTPALASRVTRLNLNRLGATRLQGIAVNPSNRHLYLLDAADQQLYELTQSGELLSTFDLSSLQLTNPQAIVFAPSVDRTDDPNIYNLVILDEAKTTVSKSSETSLFKFSSLQSADSTSGQLVEVSLIEAAALPAGTPLLPASLVKIVDISNKAWSPSSPDPAGIDYWPQMNRLLITDSEVDEMPPYWVGANVFAATTSGSLLSTCSTTSFTNEPTGLAINPETNRIYIATDSGTGRLYEINLGPDGNYCTSDDIVVQMTFNTDLEDVAYGNNTLFIAGGVDAEVWMFNLGPNRVIGGGDDGPLTHYDTARWGFNDLEGIGFNSDAGTVFLASSQGSENYIGEVTASGTLLRAYNVSFMGTGGNLRSDVAYAPSSGNPAVKNIYIVSRGVDNGANPNENDGKWWEISIGSTPTTPTSTPTFGPSPTPTNTPTSTNTSAPTFTPTATPTATLPAGASSNPLYASFATSGSLGGVSFADEDILRFDGQNWSLFFDGSDVGLSGTDVVAFNPLNETSLLLAFSGSPTLNGVVYSPNDIVRFNATSLGTTTAGTFSMYLDGSDVGLDTSAEKIDALGILPNGNVLISTTGNSSLPGVTWNDEDILEFTPTSLGDNTSGTWSWYFDGSDVGLSTSSNEDLDALDVAANGDIYLSTLGAFDVTNVLGVGEDVFSCTPGSLGSVTTCSYSSSLYFDGSTWGLSGNTMDAFHLLTLGPVPTATNTSTPSSTPTASNTPTATATSTPTFTATIGPSPTPTNIAAATFTATNTPTPSNTPLAPNTPTPTNTPLATDTPTQTSTPTATFTSPPLTGNLLVNPGFELDANGDGRPDNWSSNATFSLSNELVLTESFAGKFSSTSGSSANILQTVNNLTAGTTYNVSGWVNIPQPAGASFFYRLKIEWRNGTTLIYRDTVASHNTATDGWTQGSASLVAPEGTTNARILLAVTGLNGTFYVDDFFFGP